MPRSRSEGWFLRNRTTLLGLPAGLWTITYVTCIRQRRKAWRQGSVEDARAAPRKITVEVPPELLEKALEASGGGITQTVRTGLQLVAASQAYAQLRQLRGKVSFTHTPVELKNDR